MYSSIFLCAIFCTFPAITCQSNATLGKQLIAQLQDYNARFAQWTDEMSHHSSDQWHQEHQKNIQEMIHLVKKGADLTLDDESGVTALLLTRGFLCDSNPLFNEFIKLLVVGHAAHRDRLGNPINADVCGIRKLVEYGLRLTVFDDQMIVNAAYEPNEKMELLLNAGGNPHALRSQDGPTALMIAAAHNNLLAVKALVQHLDMVNQRYEYTGATALHYACDDIAENLNRHYLEDKYAIIELLLAKGGIINAKDNTGATPLIHAIKSQGSHNVKPEQRLIDLILSGGADPLIKDNRELSALHYASHKELTQLTQAILFAMARYQPQKLSEAVAHTHVDIADVVRKNHFYHTMHYRFVQAFDVFRYVIALFGIYQAIVMCNQRPRSGGKAA